MPSNCMVIIWEQFVILGSSLPIHKNCLAILVAAHGFGQFNLFLAAVSSPAKTNEKTKLDANYRILACSETGCDSNP